MADGALINDLTARFGIIAKPSTDRPNSIDIIGADGELILTLPYYPDEGLFRSGSGSYVLVVNGGSFFFRKGEDLLFDRIKASNNTRSAKVLAPNNKYSNAEKNNQMIRDKALKDASSLRDANRLYDKYRNDGLGKFSGMSVYLSPSLQTWNKGVGNYGNEKERMNQIADVVQRELEALGITIYRNNYDWTSDSYTTEHINEIINDSNSKSPTIHVALHSNALNGSASGIIIFSKNNNSSNSLAADILNEIMTIAPTNGWSNQLKSGYDIYGETTSIKADSVLIEYAFHDNSNDAKWITDNITEIGKLTAQGIINNLLKR